MAKTTSITKSLSMKFETYKFANSDLFVCMTRELDEGDDPEVEGKILAEQVVKEFAETKAILDGCSTSFYKLPQCFS